MELFPEKELPDRAEKEVLTDVFEELINKASEKTTAYELRRAKKVVSDLRNGAEAFQKSDLPPVNGVNAQSTFAHGQLLTDTIATWVKKGFVVGPFDCPPVAGFRANPSGVIVKNGKIRPILNMNRRKLERLHMGTAKQFSYALKNAGVEAVFSKYNIQDAYKLMPV